jgi:HNH endonuclease
MSGINKKQRAGLVVSLRERDGDNCWICGRALDFEASSGDARATLDHVTRSADGGVDNLTNLRLACALCNFIPGLFDACGLLFAWSLFTDDQRKQIIEIARRTPHGKEAFKIKQAAEAAGKPKTIRKAAIAIYRPKA